MAIQLKEFFIHALREATPDEVGGGSTFQKVDPAAAGGGAAPSFQAVTRAPLLTQDQTQYFNSVKGTISGLLGQIGIGSDEAVMAGIDAIIAGLDNQAYKIYSETYAGGDDKAAEKARAAWHQASGKLVDAFKGINDSFSKIGPKGGGMAPPMQ